MFNVILFFCLFSIFFSCAVAGDVAPAGIDALLRSLLAAQSVNTSGSGVFPWQHTSVYAVSTTKFLFKSFLLSEIPGLVQQARSALFQNVSNVQCTIRKIPGIDVTWRAFVAADDDLEPSNFETSSLLTYVRNHPGAVPQHTLDKDTTQSTIIIPIIWLNGLGTSVTTVLPPLRTPRIVIFAETSGTFVGKELVVTLSGDVSISGYGYVAGVVAREGPPA